MTQHTTPSCRHTGSMLHNTEYLDIHVYWYIICNNHVIQSYDWRKKGGTSVAQSFGNCKEEWDNTPHQKK